LENLHAIASNRSVIGFSYVAVCLLFSSLFLFRIVHIWHRRKVRIRCISSVMSFLLLRWWELQQNILFIIMLAVCNWRLKDGTELQVFVAEVKKQVVGVAVIRREEVNFLFLHTHTNMLFCCDPDLDPSLWYMKFTWRFWSCICIPKVDFLGQGFQKLVHYKQIDILTDATKCITSPHL